MKTVLKLLRKELREWREQHKQNKEFYRIMGENFRAIDSLKESELHINELKQAIEILSK